MATYYSSPTSQRDNTPTLYLRDPGRAPYPESSLPGNMLFSNYSTSGIYSDTLAGSSQAQQNCVELHVPTILLPQESSVGELELDTSHLGGHTCNAWRSGRNEMSFMQTIGGSTNFTDGIVHGSVTDDPQVCLGTQLGILNGKSLSLQQPSVSSLQSQGLSLSLGMQIPVPSFLYQPYSSDISFVGSYQSASGNDGSCRDGNAKDKQMHLDLSSYGLSSPASTISNSKYLKAAEQLVDEVINVRKALKQKLEKSHASGGSTGSKGNDRGSKSDEMHQNPQESTVNFNPDLSPAERQDLQKKMTKLLAMLDEVDRRYKQYYHQMEIVVSSFDVIAGCGAAKPYTALALQTISRHFRCLRDSISGQIEATRKILGERDTSSGKEGGLARLRHINQHLRQQRAFLQFGMMQQQVWRPQRGLPESSVSVLRAWLFENFLHPYPKDSDKLMLARQTGLARSQVSNWFINARVRLWKPMVEEMYKEETGDTEMDSNSSENPPKGRDDNRSPGDRDDSQSTKSASERCHSSQFKNSSESVPIPDVEMDSAAAGLQAEANTGDNNHMSLKLREQRPTADDCNLLSGSLVQPDGGSRFMAYHMAGLGGYENGGVSLTLGLQHFDGGLPVTEAHQSFLTMRGDGMYNPAPLGIDTTTDYDCLNLGDRRHGLDTSHLLHDFVA